MGTTRYYAGPGSGTTPPTPVFPYSLTWERTPAAGSTDNNSRRRAGSAVPTESVNGVTAQKPADGAGTTAGMQLHFPAFTEARSTKGSFRLVTMFAFIGSAQLRALVRLVAADGTIRGTVADVSTGLRPSTSTPTSTTLAGELAALNAQVGDFLVLELGAAISNGLGGSANVALSFSSSATDMPYADGDTTSGRRWWVELTLDDPPNPPTGLTADPAITSVDLSWTAPSSGPEVAGYVIVLDDGREPVEVGNVTSWRFDDLYPGTSYTAQVYAVGPSGLASAPATVAFTTDPVPPGFYRAVVRLGSHTWDVNAGDPAELGPILPLSFGWAVPEDSLGFPAQPDPDTCQLELVTADGTAMAGVDIGTTMRVSIYLSPNPGSRPLATFRGRVGDLEAFPHRLGLSWRVLGVGYPADLGRQVGTTAWPQESGDARAARAMAEAGFPGWSSDAIGATFEPRNPQATTARAVLEEVSNVAVSADGNQYGPSRRVLVHPNTDDEGELVPAGPFAGRAVLRQVDAIDRVSAALVNRRTSWRRTKLLDAAWVKIDHPGGPTVYGDTRKPSAYPSLSVPITDPRELADLVLDTTPGYRWLTGDALRLELWADQAGSSPVGSWFYRDPASHPFPWVGRAVIVENIAQAPDGSTTYAGMLAAAQLVLEPSPPGAASPGGRLVILFRLRPEIPAQSTVTMRWMDEPAGASWADELAEDPTGTWYDYRTRARP